MASADVLHPAALPSGNGTAPPPQAPISFPTPSPPSSPKIETSLTGVPKTIYDDVDPSFYLGPKGVEDSMTNAQGLKLRRYIWPAQNPKSVLVFVHGHGAHIFFELLKGQGLGEVPSYEGSWLESLNLAGVTVIAIDNQGCGRSEGLNGLRFYVESFDDYVNDIIQLVQTIPTVGGSAIHGLPIFLAGISLGGCIAFLAASRRPELFKGVLLLAPMLSLDRVSRKGLNPWLRPLASVLSRVIPTAPVVATDRNTLYPEIQQIWDSDPLAMHIKTRVRNANEYLRATEIAMGSLETVEFPFLVFHSENDTMCDCDGSKQLYLKAKSKDKTLRLVNQMWHVLVREAGNEKILAEMIDWMSQRTSTIDSTMDST